VTSVTRAASWGGSGADERRAAAGRPTVGRVIRGEVSGAHDSVDHQRDALLAGSHQIGLDGAFDLDSLPGDRGSVRPDQQVHDPVAREQRAARLDPVGYRPPDSHARVLAGPGRRPAQVPGGPVGVVGIGFVLVVVAADVEIGAVGVDAEPRPDCSTEPQALRETSARTPARAAATALVILILTPCAPATFLWFIPILAPGAVPVLQERGPDRAPSVITGMSTSLMRACSGLSSQPWALPGRGVPTAGRSCGLGGVGLDGRGTRAGAAGQLTLDEHTWLDSVRAITSDLMPIRNCCTSPEVAARSRFGASAGPFSTSPFEP
jgi:hypothetical protein